MGWPDIIPLESREVPDFPVAALPGVFRVYAEELAESYQVPVALPASLELAVTGAVMAKHYMVEGAQDWLEPSNLFVAVAQPPGSRKSAIFKEVARPLERMEHEIFERYRETAQEEDKTPAPRLIVDDVSPERLATLMAQNSGRIAVLSAEGGIFDTMAGRYSNSVPNLDVFLKGHAGDTLRVDRVNRSTDLVRDPALSMAITFQPDVLRGLTHKPGFRGRGLLARFLYSVPGSLLGRRKIDTAPVSRFTREAYDMAITGLQGNLSLDPNLSMIKPRIIRIDRRAAEVFADYRRSVEQALGPGGELENIQDWGGKLPGQVLRIALILWGMAGKNIFEGDLIAEEIMYAAIRIGEYFKQHALYTFELMGADPKIDAAHRLLSWIGREQRDQFTLRDAHQALKGSFPRIETIESATTLLTEHGYILHKTIPSRLGPGRKSSPVYSVNPKFYSQNSEAA